jgi:hypothetical protein
LNDLINMITVREVAIAVIQIARWKSSLDIWGTQWTEEITARRSKPIDLAADGQSHIGLDRLAIGFEDEPILVWVVVGSIGPGPFCEELVRA